MTGDAVEVQLRRLARFAYGDSLQAEVRVGGDVPVFGSNGQVGTHDRANTTGQVIIIGRKGSQGALTYSPVPVFAIDTTYFIDSTTIAPGVDLRWLFYALHTLRLDELSQDVGVPGLGREKAYSERMPFYPFTQQRAIADFLDRETVRIDEIIQRKRDLLRLCNLRRGALLVNAVLGRMSMSGEVVPTGDSALPELPLGWRPVRLRHVATEVTVGVVVTPAAFYADEGLPFIRGYNVRPGVVTDHDLARISPEANALHPKSLLRPGDVMVVRTGQAGAAAVVPDWAVGGNCVDVLIVRCAPSLQPKFLELVLNSEHAARQVETMSVGAIQSHFNVSALRDLVLPLPPVNEQARVIAVVEEEQAPMLRLLEVVNRQVQLLEEHRQAIVAAAVTGQIDVVGDAA